MPPERRVLTVAVSRPTLARLEDWREEKRSGGNPMKKIRRDGRSERVRLEQARAAFAWVALGAAIFVPVGIAAGGNHKVTVGRNGAGRARAGGKRWPLTCPCHPAARNASRPLRPPS